MYGARQLSTNANVDVVASFGDGWTHTFSHRHLTTHSFYLLSRLLRAAFRWKLVDWLYQLLVILLTSILHGLWMAWYAGMRKNSTSNRVIIGARMRLTVNQRQAPSRCAIPEHRCCSRRTSWNYRIHGIHPDPFISIVYSRRQMRGRITQITYQWMEQLNANLWSWPVWNDWSFRSSSRHRQVSADAWNNWIYWFILLFRLKTVMWLFALTFNIYTSWLEIYEVIHNVYSAV